MTLFLTSSPTLGRGGPLDPSNGFIETLRAAVKPNAVGLFVTSEPENPGFTDGVSAAMRCALEAEGITFSDFFALDDRNAGETGALTAKADLIILSGGHVPTQNAFFRRIALREHLKGYDGVLLGISAGTMNSADTVYAQPELDGESTDPAYQRFLPGLGLTQKMILPHYQAVKDTILDGKRLFEDITYPDSMGREFFAIPDGSYLYAVNGREEFRGTVLRIKDGKASAYSSL